jgi:hypothetical protein
MHRERMHGKLLEAVCRYDLTLKQDPNSHHLGLTVWDASIVLAKYLEQVRPCRVLLHA